MYYSFGTGVSCGSHSVVNSSTLSASSSLFYQDAIAIVCDVGHELADGAVNVTRVCQADEKFSGSVPVCSQIQCPDLGQPVNGQRSTDVLTFRTVQNFTCNRGYNMTGGSKSIECLANKSWTGTVPVCSSKFTNCRGTVPSVVLLDSQLARKNIFIRYSSGFN